MVSTLPGGRSPRPAGMAQLGYACFWPNGGGIKEGGVKPPSLQSSDAGSSSNSGEELEGNEPGLEQNDPVENGLDSTPTDENSEMNSAEVQEGSS